MQIDPIPYLTDDALSGVREHRLRPNHSLSRFDARVFAVIEKAALDLPADALRRHQELVGWRWCHAHDALYLAYDEEICRDHHSFYSALSEAVARRLVLRARLPYGSIPYDPGILLLPPAENNR